MVALAGAVDPLLREQEVNRARVVRQDDRDGSSFAVGPTLTGLAGHLVGFGLIYFSVNLGLRSFPTFLPFRVVLRTTT